MLTKNPWIQVLMEAWQGVKPGAETLSQELVKLEQS